MIVVSVHGVRDVTVLGGDNEPFANFRCGFYFQGGRRICHAVRKTELDSGKMSEDYIRFLNKSIEEINNVKVSGW
jgi:hypothetical protein